MNYENYKEHIQALDSLWDRAYEIARLARPHAEHVYVDDFDLEHVTVHCSWANYHEEETISFPAEWLFDPDWQTRVAERLAKERAEEDAKKRKAAAEKEQAERNELYRLQEKYKESQPS